MGEYFSIRQPDSGLSVSSDNNGCVSALNLNNTSIDPFRATTTINTNTFKLIDKKNAVTTLFGTNPQIFQGELVEIWLGRVGVNMDFSDYYKVTDTFVTKVSKQDSSYTFATREAKDRLSTGAFSIQQKLAVDILSGTTVITLQDTTNLPLSGLIKIDDEFISYTGIAGNNLTGCLRGEEGSTPDGHDLGTTIYLCEVVQANPITLLLQLLISSGGGGVYDVLPDGASIDQNLIDVAQFEQVRTEFFSSLTFKFILYNIESLRKFMEDEIMFPIGIRLRANNNSKIGCGVLNHPVINLDAPDFTNDIMTKTPVYNVDETKITNRVTIEWNYFDPTEKFLNISEYSDAVSILQFGERKPLKINVKGVRASLGGQAIVDQIAYEFFARFAFPKPTIDTNTHMSGSEWLLGEKPYVESNLIPTDQGDLNFGDTMEIIERAINFNTGDTRFKLMFTQFTGLRVCFIAPSDSIVTVNSQSSIDIGAGRGEQYRVGWKMRLYDNVTRDHADTQVNEIATIVGDTITFVDPWTTTLVATDYRIMFADYDDVTEQQKRFCFTSCGTFPDGKPEYNIVC